MDTIGFNKACWAQERDGLRRVIAAATDDKLDWAPDPRSRSARRLIGHLIGHVQDLTELARDGVIHHRNEVQFANLDEALALFDQAYAEMLEELDRLDSEGWAKPAEFLVGDMSVMNEPVEKLSWILLFDSIHHRGQLTVHLRPTGARVPSLYGPSLDDLEEQGHPA